MLELIVHSGHFRTDIFVFVFIPDPFYSWSSTVSIFFQFLTVELQLCDSSCLTCISLYSTWHQGHSRGWHFGDSWGSTSWGGHLILLESRIQNPTLQLQQLNQSSQRALNKEITRRQCVAQESALWHQTRQKQVESQDVRHCWVLGLQTDIFQCCCLYFHLRWCPDHPACLCGWYDICIKVSWCNEAGHCWSHQTL